MEFKMIVALFALCIVGVMADQKACINKKYGDDLGERYNTCYARAGDLPIPRMKKCYQEVMKTERVVIVANDGQMTVDRTKFGEFAQQNSNNNVGKSMKTCYDNNLAGSDMYNEAARASQCVFLEMKKGC